MPSARLLPWLLAELDHVAAARIATISGTGSHRVNTEEELASMVGADVLARHRVVNHSAHDPSRMLPAGRTMDGHTVFMNRDYVEADRRIVVTTNSGYPLDQNLYQTVKGMSAAAQIVAEGGFILAASRCNDGFPAHGNFRKLLFDHDSARAVRDTILAPGFSVYDQWEAQLLALICLKARVGLYSEIPTEEVRRAHLEPVGDIPACIQRELDRAGKDAPIAVLPEGPMTIPYLVG